MSRFNAPAQVRLDLFGHLGIYGRLNWLDNNAPPEVLTETLTDWSAAWITTCKWFRTGAEYEDYDSNFTQYQAMRFFQDFDFALSDASRGELEFQRDVLPLSRATATRRNINFITRYNTRSCVAFTWYVEGGCSLAETYWAPTGRRASARTGISWIARQIEPARRLRIQQPDHVHRHLDGRPEQNHFFTYMRRTF